METLRYILALWRVDGIGPATINKLLDKNIALAELFHDPATVVQTHALPARLVEAVKKADWRGADTDLAWAAAQPHHHLLVRSAADYPPLLRQIAAAPPVLFVSGDPQTLLRPQLAMVGSRNPTPAGYENAWQFAKALVHEGLTITSGLAVGIDAASHEGALANGGKTIAVMATGPDRIYPRQNVRLQQRIIEEGAVVTEFPVGVAVSAINFPRRNRIISGLSLGVLVAEAAAESGSLITARYALEQNREVFAMPGSIHNPLARGCHTLIKQGAKLVETVAEILEELRWYHTPSPATPSPLPAQPSAVVAITAEQQHLLSAVGFEMTPVDVLVTRSGLTAEKVSSMLLLLELQGQISAVPGGYVRCPPLN